MTQPRDTGTIKRRGFLGLCGLVGGALWLPTIAGCGTTEPPQAQPTGGGPLKIPTLLDGDLVDGVRVFRLQLQQGTMEWVAGAPTATYGVNGAYLGPTLRFRKGERVRIEVKNTLGETSTLHWHGMELPARSDGGPYQMIEPGATWISEYTIVQRPMTAWYHPHQMHKTAGQVYMGMAGMILVEDPTAPPMDLPSAYGVDDLPLVIQDRRLFEDGTHPYSNGNTPSMRDSMAGIKGDTMLVNGTVRPRASVPKGLVRLRILNGSNARNYHLGFEDNRKFQQIASDGGLLDAPIEATRLLLAPGERAEILVDFGTGSKSIGLKSYSSEVHASLFASGGGMGMDLADGRDKGTFDLMTFETTTEATRSFAVPKAFNPISRMATKDAVRNRAVALSMTMGMGSGGMGMLINGESMMDLNEVPTAIDFRIPVGDTEIWVVTNKSNMSHPLHIHNRHFQVLDINGAPPPAQLAGWKDTILVRPNQTVRLILKFDGVADSKYPYMFHCHILEHEDHGMMGRFFLV